MNTYTSTAFRQNSYRLISQVAKTQIPIRITSRNKHRLSNDDTYLVSARTLEAARKYREFKRLRAFRKFKK